MKIIALNGSQRSLWNTAQMVESALEGARSAGAETKRYNLYSMEFKGCASCFGCKLLGSPGYGRCAIRDALTPVLDEVLDSADGLILGSPVYFGDVTACVRAFLERLWFSGLAYSRDKMILHPRRIPVRIIFTTNAPSFGFHKSLNESLIGAMDRFIGPTELIEANGTLQFDDYSKYETSMFDVDAIRKRHEEVFPEDLQRAFELGKNLVKAAQ